MHRGAILGDTSYDDACGLASCCSLGFAASSVAMAVAGKKVVEMGVMRPDLLYAESMRAVKFGSSIGFYALVAGLLPRGTARGNDIAGLIFLASGAGCAAASAKFVPEIAEDPMKLGLLHRALLVCSGLGLVGLVGRIVNAMGGHPIYGAASEDPELLLAANADVRHPILPPLACAAVAAFAAFAAVAAVFRRRPASPSLATPLLQ